MTIWHVNLIFEPLLPGLSTAQTLVLSRMAIRAAENHVCWPGATLLAREARMTIRGVYKVLKELEAEGIITKRKGNYDTHYRSLYEMTYAVEYLKKLEQEKAAPPMKRQSPANYQNPLVRSPRPGVYDDPLARRPDETATQYAARIDRRR